MPELESVNPGVPGRRDLGLAGAPRGSASLSARYERPLGDRLNIGLDTRLTYVGRSRLSFDAATAPAMWDYVAERLGLSLSAERWDLSVAVDNSFDGAGDTFAYGNPFTLKSMRQTTPQRPRSISVSLRVQR